MTLSRSRPPLWRWPMAVLVILLIAPFLTPIAWLPLAPMLLSLEGPPEAYVLMPLIVWMTGALPALVGVSTLTLLLALFPTLRHVGLGRMLLMGAGCGAAAMAVTLLATGREGTPLVSGEGIAVVVTIGALPGALAGVLMRRLLMGCWRPGTVSPPAPPSDPL